MLAAGIGSAASASEPPRAGSVPPELESLLEGFASMPGLAARFREERHLALLRDPLVSHGVFYFAPPRRLVRHVEQPLASTVLVQGDEIAFSSDRGKRTIDLAASPALGSLVEGVRLVLAGDVDRLGEIFRIEFESPGASDTGRWTIRLEPRRSPLRDVITSIAFAGRGSTPTELRVLEGKGDETVTHFTDVETDRRFSDDEIAQLFRVPPP